MKRVAYISAALVVAMMLASGCQTDILGPDTDRTDLVGDPADFNNGSTVKPGTDPIGDGPIPMLPYPKDVVPDPREEGSAAYKPGTDPVKDGPTPMLPPGKDDLRKPKES